jgi:hypothetical protein
MGPCRKCSNFFVKILASKARNLQGAREEKSPAIEMFKTFLKLKFKIKQCSEKFQKCEQHNLKMLHQIFSKA